MKKYAAKFPAMIALGLRGVSFALVLGACAVSLKETVPEVGMGRSFALWIYSFIAAAFSLLFYLLDALVAHGGFTRREKLVNRALILLSLGSVPMLVYVGAQPGLGALVWNLYYLAMFGLEVASVMMFVRRYR